MRCMSAVYRRSNDPVAIAGQDRSMRVQHVVVEKDMASLRRAASQLSPRGRPRKSAKAELIPEGRPDELSRL